MTGSKVLMILSLCWLGCLQASPLNRVPGVEPFIQHMVDTHKFDRADLNQLFTRAQTQPQVLEFIAKPFEDVPWFKYEARFLGAKRVREGVEFWHKHRQALKRVQQLTGVPAEIIIAIIGVETFYGRFQGLHPVLESLSTLAFQYPPRAKFFKKELEQFLLMAREQKFDPLSLQGSYAGALGIPQFMPSSYRHYAVKYISPGPVDLFKNNEDAIRSVANYFVKSGWQANQAVICPVKHSSPHALQHAPPAYSSTHKNPKPNMTLAELKLRGFAPRHASCTRPHEKVAFLAFEDAKAQSHYYMGLHNFYVITRYNHSINYAMAVYQLSLKLKAAMTS